MPLFPLHHKPGSDWRGIESEHPQWEASDQRSKVRHGLSAENFGNTDLQDRCTQPEYQDHSLQKCDAVWTVRYRITRWFLLLRWYFCCFYTDGVSKLQSIRWAGHVARMKRREMLLGFGGEMSGRSPLIRPNRRWKYNAKLGMRDGFGLD